MEKLLSVYKAISAVSNELLIGIAKNSKNQQQGFMFRGIDSVYNTLAPILVKHHLIILPRMIDRSVVEKVTNKGTQMSYVSVKAEFDFVCSEDGSMHTVATYGEASDSGDKATNKAMAIAYKYAAFQTFCIPTEDTSQDPDAEAHVFVRQGFQQSPQQQRPIQTKPHGITAEQIGVLSEAITHKGYAVPDACISFGVNSLADINPSVFNGILDTVLNEWPQV